MNPFKVRKKGDWLESYLAPMILGSNLEETKKQPKKLEVTAKKEHPYNSTGIKLTGKSVTGTRPKDKSHVVEMQWEIPANKSGRMTIKIDLTEVKVALEREMSIKRSREEEKRAQMQAFGESLGILRKDNFNQLDRYHQWRESHRKEFEESTQENRFSSVRHKAEITKE